MADDMKKDIIFRLRTIKGHIDGIEKMVEEGKTCDEILLQIAAIKSSIEKVGYSILENHAKECLVDIEKQGVNVEKVNKVIQSVLKFVK
ncbi:metal-sensitive transcriptional regulator [Caldanaerobius polysaccharolyticus]|uniref:metal-sensitive transcriptional regulator n=1 Tax=Caldanaerobius polysaccharolyticus TaxID=44256 RepID=UPI00047C3914|nr:metal-sensitive transcriptional regulator [Caldanaerobius polysaccharolyticus]